MMSSRANQTLLNNIRGKFVLSVTQHVSGHLKGINLVMQHQKFSLFRKVIFMYVIEKLGFTTVWIKNEREEVTRRRKEGSHRSTAISTDFSNYPIFEVSRWTLCGVLEIWQKCRHRCRSFKVNFQLTQYVPSKRHNYSIDLKIPKTKDFLVPFIS